MKNLVFAVNVILDAWLNPASSAVNQLLAQSKQGNYQGWVGANSLSLLEHQYRQALVERDGISAQDAQIASRQQVAALLSQVQVLSNFAHQLPQALASELDLADAQLLAAASALQGVTALVTTAPAESQERIQQISPAEVDAWLQAVDAEKAIDFIDLKLQQDLIRPQLERNIHQILAHGQYILGPEMTELETKLAAFVGSKYCIANSSGTDALLIAMMALGIQAGDEIITSPFTFIATGEMIALLGAKTVFVDIDPETYNIDPAKIEAAITPRTKAIMPVSLYGQCADFDAINAIAAKYNLPVIEDGAQSFGATYYGKQSCALSTIGCTSFFPSKPLGGYGDSGACFTDDEHLAKLMREIRLHGQDRRYHHPRIGINGRMDTLQAGILLAKLELFADEVAARARIGQVYSDLIHAKNQQLPTGKTAVIPPVSASYNTSVYAQYTSLVEDRDGVQQRLQALQIPTAVHYPVPLNLQPALATDEYTVTVSTELSNKVMSLPMHPYLDLATQQRVINALFAAL